MVWNGEYLPVDGRNRARCPRALRTDWLAYLEDCRDPIWRFLGGSVNCAFTARPTYNENNDRGPMDYYKITANLNTLKKKANRPMFFEDLDYV